MYTEKFCPTLDRLDPVEAIRAIHRAWLQLRAIGLRAEVDGTTYDNALALHDLQACLRVAGHPAGEERA